MAVYSNSELIPQMLPGLSHRTLAGPEHGMKGLEIWSQSLDASAATAPHRHDCEEVVIAVSGAGAVAISGNRMNFSAGDTVIIPRNEIHQIFNMGESSLRLFSVLNMAPVRIESPNGDRMTLPWQHTGFAGLAAPPLAAGQPATLASWSLRMWLWQCCLAAFGRQETQRQRIALFELEDGQLRDIGLSRQEALDEARKPFWK